MNLTFSHILTKKHTSLFIQRRRDVEKTQRVGSAHRKNPIVSRSAQEPPLSVNYREWVGWLGGRPTGITLCWEIDRPSVDRLAHPNSLLNLRVGPDRPTVDELHIYAHRSTRRSTDLMPHPFFWFSILPLKHHSTRVKKLYVLVFDLLSTILHLSEDFSNLSQIPKNSPPLRDRHKISAARSTHDLCLAEQAITIELSNDLHHYDCLRTPCPGGHASRNSSK